jgi:hypothetical protein
MNFILPDNLTSRISMTRSIHKFIYVLSLNKKLTLNSFLEVFPRLWYVVNIRNGLDQSETSNCHGAEYALIIKFTSTQLFKKFCIFMVPERRLPDNGSTFANKRLYKHNSFL